MAGDAILAVEQRNLGRDVEKVAQDARAGGDERAQRGIVRGQNSTLLSLYAPTMRLLKSATLSTSSVMGTWLTRLAAAGAVRVSPIKSLIV